MEGHAMKYAFMTFSTPELTLAEVLALAKRLGYDAVEPRLAAKHQHGIETDTGAAARKAIRATVAAGGVPLCCLATSCRYADPAIVAEHVSETRRCIDLAADLGVPRLRVFGGQIPQGVSREQASAGVVAALRSLAAQAESRGVTLCMETHDDWTNPVYYADIMVQVGSPNVAVNWDSMHPVRQSGVTNDAAFNALRPWIRHVHLHDGVNSIKELTMRPAGEGDFDLKRVIQLLKGAGYDGYLSGEWINWEPYETPLPRELATFRRWEREA
jgi:sugar phosphate isomerase/epimerase